MFPYQAKRICWKNPLRLLLRERPSHTPRDEQIHMVYSDIAEVCVVAEKYDVASSVPSLPDVDSVYTKHGDSSPGKTTPEGACGTRQL